LNQNQLSSDHITQIRSVSATDLSDHYYLAFWKVRLTKPLEHGKYMWIELRVFQYDGSHDANRG